jgi:hypothetical protein
MQIYIECKENINQIENKLNSLKKGEITFSEEDFTDIQNQLKINKELIFKSFIDSNKEIIKKDIDIGLICDNCDQFNYIDKKLSKNADSILNLDFSFFKNKQEMISFFEKKDDNYFSDLSIEYNSNILHEVVYAIYQNKYKINKDRNKYILFLQYLSTRKVFQSLIKHKNCRNETAGETFNRICEYKNNTDYQYILKLLRVSQSYNTTHKMDKNLNEIAFKYHQKQNELFNYLENNYSDILYRCDKCNTVINIVDDFHNIGKIICADPKRKYLINLIEEIIQLRNESNNLFEKSNLGNIQSNFRHQKFIDILETLLTCFFDE